MCLPDLASLSHSQSLAVCEVEEFCPGAVYVAMMSDSLTERYFRKKKYISETRMRALSTFCEYKEKEKERPKRRSWNSFYAV